MDLSTRAIHDIVHPTAIFSRDAESRHAEPGHTTTTASTATTHASGSSIGHDGAGVAPIWDRSPLNPKNRLESLDLPAKPMWRVDGSTGLGTQFYAVPLFFSPVPPMRIDVFIPEMVCQSRHVRHLLDLASAFHTKDGSRVAQLGISAYIVRALNMWARSFVDFEIMYKSLPFGTRIIFENLPLDLRDLRIEVGQTHQLEQQALSVKALSRLWGIDQTAAPHFFPQQLDLFALDMVEQVHDSTCIVKYGGELLIFKSLTSYTKYMYHELWNLLSMKPHPNIISRPRHLITKECRFGGKRAVVGFTLEYHPPGTMRDIVPIRRVNGRLKLRDQLRWAKQITGALIHIHETGGPFYPDLRLDNVVLTNTDDAVLIDFEQRGVWCEFGAPEVNALEYVRLLATDDEAPFAQASYPSESDDEPVSDSASEHGSSSASRYASLMSRLLPEYKSILTGEGYTRAAVTSGGYNASWLCLTPREREAAEVYMLGRVLYCIFEGVAAPQKAAVWQSYRWESDIEFPRHLRAPSGISQLIDKCTRGRRPTMSNQLSRAGDKITLVGRNGPIKPGREHPDAGLQEIYSTARAFWRNEIAHAVDFLERREKAMKAGSWDENFFGRPTTKEVLVELEQISKELGV